MKPAFGFSIASATAPERRAGRARLLVIDRGGVRASGGGARVELTALSSLPGFLRRGDRVVVNEAATVPASLRGRAVSSDRPDAEIELRLASLLDLDKIGTDHPPGAVTSLRWRAVLFGAGDWRTPTELRPPPPLLRPGDRLRFATQGTALEARIFAVDADSPRLIDVELRAPDVWRALYALGRPIQYAYLDRELALWDQQTVFSGAPLAIEPPSASFQLTWDLMFRLRARGVEILRLSHGTGLSDTGDAALNARLPFAEPTLIPRETQESVLRARREGARVVAIGTGVARALESWGGALGGESFVSRLKIGESNRPRIATGLLTGLHEAGASHLELLAAFCARSELQAAYARAAEAGYLWHEYGDVCLVI